MITEQLLTLKAEEVFQTLCEDTALTMSEIERVLRAAAHTSPNVKPSDSYGKLKSSAINIPEKLQTELIEQLQQAVTKSATSMFAKRLATEGQPVADDINQRVQNMVNSLEQQTGRYSEITTNIKRLALIGRQDPTKFIAMYALMQFISRAAVKFPSLNVATFLSRESVRILSKVVSESVLIEADLFSPAELLAKYNAQHGGTPDRDKIEAFLQAEGMTAKEAKYIATEFLNHGLKPSQTSVPAAPVTPPQLPSNTPPGTPKSADNVPYKELIAKYEEQYGSEADKKKLVQFLRSEGYSSKNSEDIASKILAAFWNTPKANTVADDLFKQWQSHIAQGNDDSAATFYRFLVAAGYPENLVSMAINSEFGNKPTIDTADIVSNAVAGSLPPNRSALLGKIEGIVSGLDKQSRQTLQALLMQELTNIGNVENAD